jgi:hypothetical protein
MPRTTKLPLFLLPIAALLAILPLLLHGISCGQDLSFHLQSWLDAAHQLGQGDYPHWAITPAWNAGEPRFLFYPPLSWLLGAALTSVLPIAAAPIAYIFLALLASGFAMYHLARQYTSTTAAFIAAAFYLANPYILFCAYERTAFAELLAAAWIPLLFAGLFKPRPTVRAIAIPLALLWLTNAPAAVMASYAFALLALLRILFVILSGAQRSRRTPAQIRYPDPSGSGLIAPEEEVGFSPRGMLSRQPSPFRLTQTFLYATLLGLTLPAFYLIPAAYERQFVQVAMAIIPNMRVQDNYLFTTTADAAHNAVNHTASTLALTLLALTIFTLIGLFLFAPSPLEDTADTTDRDLASAESTRTLATTLTILTVVIALLLTPASSLLWQHLPSLQYLQFPWRLLTLLSAVLAFALALLIHRLTQHRTRNAVISTEGEAQRRRSGETPAFVFPSSPAALPEPALRYPDASASGFITAEKKWGFSPWGLLALALPIALTFLGYHLYAQACDTPDQPSTLATLYATHHGAPPTDEYTPTAADNDTLRSNNPGWWLATSPNTQALHTTPTASELDPSITTDDTPVPDSQTLSTPAPHSLTVHTNRPGYLILNLRDYPNWRVTERGEADPVPFVPKHLQRDDGLLVIPITAAGSTLVNIDWHYSEDQILGLCLSGLALMLLFWNPEPTYRS